MIAASARPAFLGEDGAVRLTYAELDILARRHAAALAPLGEGARVAVLAHSDSAIFALLLACARTGTILVPLNRRLSPPELATVLADCDPALLLCDAAHMAAGQALHRRVAALETFGAEPSAGEYAPPPDRPWYLLYTSGTTGAAKGVIHTARMAEANRVNAIAATGLSANDTVLAAMPLFHTSGINLYALPALMTGARVILLPGFDPPHVAAALAHATIMLAVPQCYRRLLDLPGFVPPPGMRHWGCGGAPLPDGLVADALARFMVLQNGMGMTETGPTALVMDRAAVSSRPESAGRAQPLTEVRLVADGRDVAAGETGELWFRGPGVTPGYWRRPAETAAAFHDDWLRSGDLATRDAEGYVSMLGRLDDMFVSGGENVHPGEVERVLRAHPAVADAAVAGRPDPRWGASAHAWIVPAGEVDTAELAAWCRDRLAAYKVPRDFTLADTLPRTDTGKLMRRLLPDPSPLQRQAPTALPSDDPVPA